MNTKRYQILDTCFRDTSKKYFLEDLLIACDQGGHPIKRRQFFEDLKFMESPEGWSIELNKTRDGRKVYYRYQDPYFSINASVHPLIPKLSPGKTEKIQILVKGSFAESIITHPIHNSQKIIEQRNDGQILISINVNPDADFISFILSKGDDVVVEHPEILRLEIQLQINAMYQGYFED
ncbi:MAG: WYL domain-containing protein [Flavobacteriaceae bacterium]